jgi:hypothetical protein
MNNWVRLPDDNPRWLNLSQAVDIKVFWDGNGNDPRTFSVVANFPKHRSVTLYRAATQLEAVTWVEAILT